MKRILLSVGILLITACNARQPVYVDKPSTTLPPVLKTLCSPVQELPAHITMGTLYEHYSQLVHQYTECRIMNKAKVDWANSQEL